MERHPLVQGGCSAPTGNDYSQSGPLIACEAEAPQRNDVPGSLKIKAARRSPSAGRT